MEHEPHRPNYAELKNAQEEALQQREQQQEVAPEPTRPDRIRSGDGWSQSASMPAPEEAALKRNDELNPGWKEMLKNPELAQKMQEQRDQQQAAQRENKGPEHDPTDGGRNS